jgi:glucokinase
MARLVLAGDVGGSKTLLGLFALSGREGPRRLRVRRYSSPNYADLEAVCADFLRGASAIDAACFGVPGIVMRGAARAANLAWIMSENSLSRALGGAPVRLLNDLAAAARGVPYLRRSEYRRLNRRGRPIESGNLAVIAAGTGLGEAALVFDGAACHAVASEGGHGSFAPRGAEQIALLEFLEREFGHVSWERILSGPGLMNVYRFVRSRSRRREPRWLSERLKSGDPAAAVADAALGRRDAVCAHAVEMFCAMYGSEAGNLALRMLALGGVYLCGGIAPRILPILRRGEFMRAFRDKGLMSSLLENIEVRVSLSPEVALRGAAHTAAALLE